MRLLLHSYKTPTNCTAKYVTPFIHIPFKFNLKTQVFVSVDSIFRLKYIPWLIAVIFITFFIGFNFCVFVLFVKLYRCKTQIDVLVIIFLVLLASLLFLQAATHTIYCRATEMKTFINELMVL